MDVEHEEDHVNDPQVAIHLLWYYTFVGRVSLEVAINGLEKQNVITVSSIVDFCAYKLVIVIASSLINAKTDKVIP